MAMTNGHAVRTVAGAVLAGWLVTASAAEMIHRAEWPVVRSGMTLLQLPAMQRVMVEFDRVEDGRIVIHYPGGDRGMQWATDLRDWLVALGVSASRIDLAPGSGIPDTLVIYATTDRVR